jgi:multiple sugar transport system substrate-binding protein
VSTPKTTIQLTGISWDHSRALPPLVATAQRYEENHGGVRIFWQKRTLDEFGHMPIDVLAQKFDLIVIDHPWSGFCFEKKLVRDLLQFTPAAIFDELKNHSIGSTFHSYLYQGKLLALPIDAATPAPSWRPDLLERHDVQPPQNWAQAVALSRRKLAVIPGFNADLFLHFFMLLKALGTEPCKEIDNIAPREITKQAIELLRELTEPMPREIFEMNPIMVAEKMSKTDDFAWNAFAYTYNNYARPGFASKQLRFGNLFPLKAGGPRLRSVLGGTGIAISSHCQNVKAALDYALFVASGNVQRGIYVQAGGQPSHRSAWDDVLANQLCGNFFNDTRVTQSEAIVRPRFSGYVAMQTEGGIALQECLRDGRSLMATLEKLDTLYRESRARGGKHFQTN